MHTRRLTCTTKKSIASGSAGSRSCEAWYYNKLHAGLKTAALFVFQRGREKKKTPTKHRATPEDRFVSPSIMNEKKNHHNGQDVRRLLCSFYDRWSCAFLGSVLRKTNAPQCFLWPDWSSAQERRDGFFLMWTCERQTVPTLMGFKGAKKVQLRLEISWNRHKVQTWWIQLLSSCSSWAESLKQLHLSGRLYFKFKVCRPVESRSLWFLCSYAWKRHG